MGRRGPIRTRGVWGPGRVGAPRFPRVPAQLRLPSSDRPAEPAGVSGRARSLEIGHPLCKSDAARTAAGFPRLCGQRSGPAVGGPCGGGAGGGASPPAGGGGNAAAVAALAAGRAAGGGRSRSRSALSAGRDAALACVWLPRWPQGAGAPRGMRRRLRADERPAPWPPGPPRAPARPLHRLRPRHPR